MTKEEDEKQRAAIDAMKGSKAAMELVLARNSKLEQALRNARATIGSLKAYIPDGAYQYPISGERDPKPCRKMADDAITAITLVVGP